MRIAVFIKSTTFNKGYGGLETQNKVLCEELVLRGYDVLVFSPQHELKCETKYENGVKYHFVPCVYRLSKFNKNNWFFKSREVFLKFHAESPFDLVISQSSAGLSVILAKRRLGIPIISISHGTILGELLTKVKNISGLKGYLRLVKDLVFVLRVFFGRQRKFINGSNKVVAVSSAVKKAIIGETFVSSEKVVVINNGIDPSKFALAEPLEFPGSIAKGRILYVGQIIKSKGVETLLKLAEEPEFSEVSFELIGGGAFLEELKGIVEKKELSNFRLYGKLAYEQVLSYFKDPSTALFAFPTKREEGFPMVLVEAMFAGLPIVAYDLGGVADAIVDNETGFLVAPGNYGLFKEKILALLRDLELQKRMSVKSLEYATDKFTITKMVDSYEQVFNEVLG